jgi:predicted ester cyclase
MTEQSNRKLVELYLAALSGKPKPAEVVSQYVDDKPLEEHIAFFEAAFPCYELRLDDIVAEGDKVALRTTFRGVQRHDFMGIPATGKEATISVMLIYRIAGGKIVEHWMNADSLGLLQQLRAVPV